MPVPPDLPSGDFLPSVSLRLRPISRPFQLPIRFQTVQLPARHNILNVRISRFLVLCSENRKLGGEGTRKRTSLFHKFKGLEARVATSNCRNTFYDRGARRKKGTCAPLLDETKQQGQTKPANALRVEGGCERCPRELTRRQPVRNFTFLPSSCSLSLSKQWTKGRLWRDHNFVRGQSALISAVCVQRREEERRAAKGRTKKKEETRGTSGNERVVAYKVPSTATGNEKGNSNYRPTTAGQHLLAAFHVGEPWILTAKCVFFLNKLSAAWWTEVLKFHSQPRVSVPEIPNRSLFLSFSLSLGRRSHSLHEPSWDTLHFHEFERNWVG